MTVRAYGPLNDFLPAPRRRTPFGHTVEGRPSVKDLLESLGIPHPEIELVLVHGRPVGFDYAVTDGDRVSVFPAFGGVDIGALSLVRPAPLDVLRFVADVHLGTLARYLRLAGLDTLYDATADDAELADLAARGSAILLTRDVGLLKRRVITHGYFVRETRPHRQFVEVLRRFGPIRLAPFTRCLRCNTRLVPIAKDAAEPALQPLTRQHYNDFQTCHGCGRMYWKGSHWQRLRQFLGSASAEAGAVLPHE